jgi:DNA polymerase-1
MRDPNVGGVGRALRPLVVPGGAGTAVGEVDLSQIEVGAAAAVYGDPDLVRMFNRHDVYSALARVFFAGEMTDEDSRLTDDEFKRRHRAYRDQMKLFTLAVIYNITPHGLAARLGVGTDRAAAERERFLSLFPALARALREASAYGAIRGYAEVCTGLRRHRRGKVHPTPWETNWMRNTPVQGSACVVFKAAGNRLRRRYRSLGARLVLPLHDAFVFECPRERLEEVAGLTAEVMRGAVQEYFPGLDPKVDVNTADPGCWNKNGKSISLDLWLVDLEDAGRYIDS